MQTDCFLTIGASHRVCEDYALAGDQIIVCDGCSTAEDTDVGARLLALAAKQWLPQNLSIEGYAYSVIGTASGYARAINLGQDCLSATLLSAAKDEKAVWVWVFGDGVVAAKTGNLWEAWEIKFPSGAPYYLKYEIDAANKAGYLKECGSEYHSLKYVWENGDSTAKKDIKRQGMSLSHNAPMGCELIFPTERYDLVVLMSDGVTSFTKTTDGGPQKVGVEEILPGLLGFKNFRGEFVQRRCNRAFEDFQDLGWQNQDDVSVAAMYVGQQ